MTLCCMTSVHIVTCRDEGRGGNGQRGSSKKRFACETESFTFIYLLVCLWHGCQTWMLCEEVCVCAFEWKKEGGILCVWMFYVSRLPRVEGQTQSIEAINVAWRLEGRQFLRSPYFCLLYNTYIHSTVMYLWVESSSASGFLCTQTTVLHSSTAVASQRGSSHLPSYLTTTISFHFFPTMPFIFHACVHWKIPQTQLITAQETGPTVVLVAELVVLANKQVT